MTSIGGDRSEDDSSAKHVEITATDGAVAAYRIDKVIIDGKADATASATVLPIDAMVVEGPPFVGREQQVARAAQMLAAGDGPESTVIVVSGPPGVGKSALVGQVARDAEQFDLVLFVDLRGYAEDAANRVLPDGVFSKLLLCLGIQDADIPSDPAAQALLYHQQMDHRAADGNPVLLWLDNASDRTQFDPLRPANPVHKVVITSRETFGHIPKRQVIEVEVLSPKEAVALLSSSLQHRNPGDMRLLDDPTAAEALAEQCDCLPLALQIAAALLADEPERPIAELVSDLASEEDRLDNLEYSDDLSVRAAISLSYRRLPGNLRRLFRLLSVVPGGDVGWTAAGWLIDASRSAVRPQLMKLVRSHLVQQHVRDRWSMHDLIRVYAAELSRSEQEDADQALRKLVKRYLLGLGAAAEWLTAVVSDTARKLLGSPDQAAAWFEAERPTAVAIALSCADRAEYPDLMMAFSIMLGEVLMSQRHWLQEFHDVMAVASSLAPQAPKAKLVAGVLNLYGSSLRMLGRYDEALEVLDRAVRVNQDAGDVSGASTSKSNIANVLADQRKVDEAVAIYLEDIEVCRTSDPPHRAHEAKSLNNLGAILAKAERFEDALGPLRQATEIRRRLGDLPGIAGAALNLGAVLLRLGGDKHDRALLEEAIDVLEEAATIFRQRGNVSKAADVANNLGQAQCKLGRFGHGIPNLAAALDYFERSGQDELAAKVRADLRFYQRRLSGY